MIYFSTVSQSLKQSFNFGLLTAAIGTHYMQMEMHNIFLENCLAVVFRYVASDFFLIFRYSMYVVDFLFNAQNRGVDKYCNFSPLYHFTVYLFQKELINMWENVVLKVHKLLCRIFSR